MFNLGTRLEPLTNNHKMTCPDPVWKTPWQKLPTVSKPRPHKAWKVMFGLHKTIVFTIPTFLQHVGKCGPTGPSFGTLWVPKSEKRCPNKLQKNHEKTSTPKHRNLAKMEYFCLVCGVPFSRFFGPGSHLATKVPKSMVSWPKCHQNVTKMTPKTKHTQLNFNKTRIKFFAEPGPAECA